jgi:hypothetical protein
MQNLAKKCFGLSGMFILIFGLSGCNPTVKVEPPDKPIQINMNINVQHKIQVQVEREIDQLIKQNKDIF